MKIAQPISANKPFRILTVLSISSETPIVPIDIAKTKPKKVICDISFLPIFRVKMRRGKRKCQDGSIMWKRI